MKTSLFVYLLSLSLLMACQEENFNAEKEIAASPLLGSWVIQEIDTAGMITVQKVSQLPADQAGITFLPNGLFIARAISGWCATPPVAYEDYEGTWQQTSSHTIHVEVQSWSGISTYEMSISQRSAQLMKYQMLD